MVYGDSVEDKKRGQHDAATSSKALRCPPEGLGYKFRVWELIFRRPIHDIEDVE